MSLLHGPVVGFAKTDVSLGHHTVGASGHVGHHHHQPAQDEHSAPSMPDAMPVCYGVGCFVALNSIAVHGPSASLLTIGTLSTGTTGVLSPIYLEPATPPPRLQV
jgi:hypothetical protein